MGRRRIRLKLKRRPRDLTKKKTKKVGGILCDFCGFSTRYDRDHTESELKRLRVLTRRMTGKDLDGLNFTELVFLENHLREVVLPIVKKKKEQMEEDLERLRIQSETVDEYGGRMRVAPRRFSSGNSSGEGQVGEAAPRIEFERRKAESMEMEFERLWLLKERLNGRELEGMTYAEMGILLRQIYQGLMDLREHRFGPTREQLDQEKKKLLTPKTVPGDVH
ncbi:uncharacterized protein LOC108822019 isoform X3 [Raphanus sativus]|uniref:Uncharacterized protein LOC108822019 isoform X3 n=1 Tax=Raphanus sativus TaxID=3726 RepID=A0A6J0KRI7_RAPSA|nr:uncharacterized protein LOC108822019 isoform X3 [Raphanus sativus]